MKRVVLPIALCICILFSVTAFPTSAEIEIPTLIPCNHMDDYEPNTVMSDIRSNYQKKARYDSDVPEGGAVVTIFGMNDTGTLETVRVFLEAYNQLTAKQKAKLRVYYLLGNNPKYENIIDLAGDIPEEIGVYYAPTEGEHYAGIFSDVDDYLIPLVWITGMKDGQKTILYYKEGKTNGNFIMNSVAEIVDGIECVESSKLATVQVIGSKLYNEALEVFRLVNIERVKNGLYELKIDATLTELAMQRAAECAVNFSHTRPNLTSCFSINDTHAFNGSVLGENIALRQINAAQVVNAWMNSPGHRANIMTRISEFIGIGAYLTGGGIAWCQLFGTSDEEPNTNYPVYDVFGTTEVKIQLGLCDDQTSNGTQYYTARLGEPLYLRYTMLADAIVVPEYKISGTGKVEVDMSFLDRIRVTPINEGEITLYLKPYQECAKGEVIHIAIEKAGPKGDIDGDRSVDAKDYQMVKRTVLGSYRPTDQQWYRMDVTGDGSVNAKDYSLLKRVVLGTYSF